MKALKTIKEHKVKIFLFALFLLSVAILFRLILTSGLHSDDYCFGVFFNDGFSSFFSSMKDHFLRSGNGRLLVHSLIAMALAPGRSFAALTEIVIIALIPIVYSVINKRRAKEAFLISSIFLCSITAFAPNALGEGFFWVSGFYNYIFPYFCLVIALWLQGKMLSNCSRSVYLVILFAEFVCGATNEQSGAATAFATAAVGFLYMLKERKFTLKYLIAPIMNSIGFASIFLSPATLMRAGGEFVYAENLLYRTGFNIARVGEYFLHDDAVVFPMLLFFLPPVLALISKRGRRLLIWGIPMGIAFLLVRNVATRKLYVFFAFALLSIYILLVSIYYAFWKERSASAALMPAGLFSVFVISLSGTIEPRVSLCLLLSIITVLSDMICEILIILASYGKKASNAVICIGALAVAAVFVVLGIPNFKQSFKNEAITKENLEAIEESRESGVLYYNMDFDTRYMHLPIFNSGFHYSAFVNYYKLQGIEIRFESEIYPDVYVDGEKLPFFAMAEGDKVFLPIESIVAALGGGVSWTPQRSVFAFLGREVILEYNVVYEGDRVYDATDRIANGRYYKMMFTKELVENAFGFEIVYDEAKNEYNIYT